MILLSLEFLRMTLYFGIYLYLWDYLMEKYLLIYYLCFCVCEGALGLSLLVVMARSFGNDYFQNLRFMKC